MLTLSRTGQNNQAHSMVVGHNFVLSSFVNALRVTYNKTLNDRPLPEFFTATDLGSKVYSPLPGYMGINVTGNGFAVGNGGTNPGYFDSDSWQLADDVDIIKGNHQISFGGNWIHTKIETLNNRPTNGAFTFNGQSTGLSLADFMMGALSGGFLQGNPVYDYDDHDYIGAYVQDDWRVGAERDRQRRRALGAVHPAAQHLQLGEQLRSGALRRRHQEQGLSAGAGRIVVPWRRRLSGPRHDARARWRSSRRASAPSGRRAATATPASAPAGACSTTRRTCSSTRALRTTRPGARRSRCRIPPAAGPTRTRPIPAAIRSRRSTPDWATQPFPAFGVYVNAPMDINPTSLQQWNVSAQRQFGDWMLSTTYLGNKSTHLWRATELNPAVFAAGATTGNTNQRRRLILQDPVQGQFYGTIGQVDDTGRGIYHGLLLSAQRRLKNNLSVLTNYTLSKCMSDPATTEITGPTIVDPNNPDLDYSYCSSDRRHVFNVSAVCAYARGRQRRGQGGVQRLAVRAARAVAERQPLVDHDRRRQRADRHGRAARACRSSTIRTATARRATT